MLSICVCGSALLLLHRLCCCFRPLIARSIAQFAPYAWNKVSLDQVFDSYTEMVEIILFPILALLVVGGIVFFGEGTRARSMPAVPQQFASILDRVDLYSISRKNSIGGL